MNFSPIAGLFLACTAGVSTAGSDVPLQIKGVKIGDPPEVACPDTPVTRTWDKHVQDMKAIGITLKPFNVSDCDPVISRTAGIPADEPAHILFSDGKVMFYKFSLSGVSLEKQGDILQALKSEFGPWKVRRNNPGITSFRWTRRGTELVVERVGDDLDSADLGFFLRDTEKMKAYVAEYDRATGVLQKKVSELRGRSILEKD